MCRNTMLRHNLYLFVCITAGKIKYYGTPYPAGIGITSQILRPSQPVVR